LPWTTFHQSDVKVENSAACANYLRYDVLLRIGCKLE
jgi:hypothetical protein